MKTRIIASLIVIATVFAVLIGMLVHERPDRASSKTEPVKQAAAEPAVSSSSEGLQRAAAPGTAEVRSGEKAVVQQTPRHAQKAGAIPALSRDELMKARVSGLRNEHGWRRAQALPVPGRGVDPVKVRIVEETSDRITLAYRMPEASITAGGRPIKKFAPKGTERVKLGNAPSRSRAGEPIVPVVPAAVVLPAGRELDRVEVMALGKADLDGEHVLEPGSRPIPLDPKAPGITPGEKSDNPPDIEIYGKDNSYPEKTYELVGVQKKRGVSVVIVNLLPVEYKPKSGKVAVYRDMTIQVTTKPAEDSGPSPRYRPDPLRPVNTQVDNPDTLNTYRDAEPTGGAVPMGLCDPADSYAYVFITSQAIRDAVKNPSVQDLIMHRKSQGMTATVVTTESILSGYNGVDDAEKLRKFILDAYNNWETDYVLLGGDTNVVPMRGLYCEAWEGSSYVDNIPSDLYFQCLDGTYNSDGDESWGEITDGPDGTDVDLAAEVYIGRVSAENTEEMSNWIYKTLDYELMSPADPFATKALMVGEYLGANFGPGIYGFGKSYMEEIRLGADTAGYTTVGFTANPAMTVDTLYDYDIQSAWPKTEIIDRINSDTYSIINHLGHAQYNYVMRFYNGDADVLSNSKFFFLNSQGCIPGAFDKDCMSEHLTTSTRHGAFAVVLNSRYGWGSYNENPDTMDGPSQRFQRQFWHAMFADYVTELGVLNALSHERNIWGINENCMRWCYYETNLQGDPVSKLNAPLQGEYLMVRNVTVDDSGGDGLVNPGETADVTVRLINLGLNDAQNVTAVVSTADAHVTVTSAESSYGTISGVGGEGDSVPPFSISVAADSPTPRQVEFELNTQSGSGETTTNVFSVWVVKNCEISGTVRKDGSPAQGVTVSVWGAAKETSAVTGADGTYSLTTSDGTQFRQASRGGWLATEGIYFTASGDISNADFDFTTATVSGTVRDETGTPVPDADVIYSGALNGQTVSGSDGSYAFSRVYGQAATLDLHAKKVGYVYYTGYQVTVPPDAVLDLKLLKMWKIRGRVTWGGSGVPDIKVHTYGTLAGGVTREPIGIAVTDADGYYAVDRWPNPEGYEYGCALASWGDAGMGYVHASPTKWWGQSEQQVPDLTYNFTMNKPVVTGTVKDKAGNPLSGAEISYTGQSPIMDPGNYVLRTWYYIDGTVTSGADGTYSIPVVMATNKDIMLNVRVSAEGYASNGFLQNVNTGAVTQDVVLGRPELQVDTISIDVSAYPGESITRTVRISNTGDSALKYAVVKGADPDKAWQIVWEREIPHRYDYPSYPDAPHPRIEYSPCAAADRDGSLWCLGYMDDMYHMTKVDLETWKVLDFFPVYDYKTLAYRCPPSIYGDLIWWFATDRVLGYNKKTGEKIREFVIPERIRLYTSYMHAGVADNGFLYVTEVGSGGEWLNKDSIWNCPSSFMFPRQLKMDPVSGEILEVVDRKLAAGNNAGLVGGFEWNSMVMINEGVFGEYELKCCSRQDWAELLNFGETQCWFLEHPTDDSLWYGIDPGPRSYNAEEEPRPTWGAEKPTFYLRTSGVPRWLGERIPNRRGIVPPGGSVNVNVVVDAAKASLGTHTGRLIIETNDPVGPVEVPVTLTLNGIVDITDVSTDNRYEVAEAAVGTLCFSDRPYRVLKLDDTLAGGLLVRTADNDKYVTAAEHLKLSLTQEADISVCVDKRIGSLPGWLTDGTWTDKGTGVVIEASDAAASPMQVFKKTVPAGTVVLGGNGAGTPAADRSNYLVIINQ